MSSRRTFKSHCQRQYSTSTVSTHPPTGIYPSDYSSLSSETTTKASSLPTDSEEEYNVEFEPTELHLAPVHHHHRKSRKNPSNYSVHEHVLISKCIDRSSIDSRSNRSLATSASEQSNGLYRSRNTGSSYTYAEPKRIEFGNFFKAIFDFFKNNPKVTKILLVALLFYAIICNIEIFFPRIVAFFVRLFYPWCRYWTVVLEQLFISFANVFTRLDGLIYATYCEFAAKNCRSRRLMCDVSCSFVDHVLSQSRPQLAPQLHQS